MPDIITANVGPDLVSTWTLTVHKLDFICFVFMLLLLKWLTLRVFALVLSSFLFGVQIIVHITLCCHITLPLLLCIILSCSSWASSQSRTPLSKLSIRLSAVRSTPGQNSHMTQKFHNCNSGLFAFCILLYSKKDLRSRSNMFLYWFFQEDLIHLFSWEGFFNNEMHSE